MGDAFAGWSRHDAVRARGLAFTPAGELLDASALGRHLAQAIRDFRRLPSLLRGLNGHFAFVFEDGERAIAACDRVRSIPLFYATDTGGGFRISARGSAELTGGSPIPNVQGMAEFYATGYVLGNDTLLKGLCQLEAGQWLCFEKRTGELKLEFYFRHLRENFLEQDENDLCNQLDCINERLAGRMLSACRGRQILVPLSGGYDSRYIVSLLKRAGRDNVALYTYGRADSFEVATAKKVAAQVGYPLHFIEHTDQKWATLLRSERFAGYLEFASHHSSLPHFQDILALEELASSGILQSPSIALPGFCGDLIGGSYIPTELEQERSAYLFKEGLPRYVFRRHLDVATDPFAPVWADRFLTRVRSTLAGLEPGGIEEFVNWNEEWFIRHKVAKFVVNAVRLFEFYGLPWAMPLWDHELEDFWLRIPSQQRIRSSLYNRYLFERHFAPLKIDFRKPRDITAKPWKLRGDLKHLLPRPFQVACTKMLNRLTGRAEKIAAFNGFDALVAEFRSEMARRGFHVTSPGFNHHLAAWLLLRHPVFHSDAARLGFWGKRC